jgi:predicted  nucleic acid-binding Zn-ribbon protein
MHPVSTAYKDAIKQPARSFSAKVQIRSNEYDDEHIAEIILDETVNPSDSFALGSAASAKLELTVIDVDDVIFENATVRPYLGLDVGGTTEYVPLGVFTVDSLTKIKNKTKLTCFDNMIKLEKPYFSDLTYPAPLNAVAQEIAAKAGVILATTLPSTLIDEISGYTLREAIGFVASFMGGFARFNRDGELEIVSYQSTDVSITADHYSDLQTAEKPFTIGKLTCKVGDSEDGPILISAGTGINEIKFENPIMTQAQLNSIYAALSTLTYMPYDIRWQGNPALQAGDKVLIADVNDHIYNTLIMEQQIKYTGGVTATAAAKGKTETAQEFSSSGPLTQKMERYAAEQANIKVLLADKANISDLTAINADIDNLFANKASVADLNATNARVDSLEATSATIAQLQAVQADIDDLAATKADITDLTAATGRISVLEGDVADIDTILSKQVFVELATVGQIVAGSSIIAEGAIGNAHISDLDVDKLNAGVFSTAKFTVQGTDGRLKIADNLLQVFDGTVELFERVALGDLNKDGSVYGLRVRGADGQTILLDHNGLTDAGFTDGYNKLENDSLDPVKLNIAQVVTRINDGTETIDSSKIYMDDKTLDVAFSTIESTVSDQGQTISSHSSQISALDSAIQLKVDTQTYNTKMASIDGAINLINTELSKATSDISVLQGQIELKVEQTDIDRAVSEIEVGGRNLIIRATETPNTWIPLNGIVSPHNNHATSDYIAVIPNQTYAFSKINSEVATDYPGYFRWAWYDEEKNYISRQASSDNEFLWEVPNGAYFVRISYPDDSSPKFEKGNKATDWTPAPEDIDHAINTVDTKIDNKVSEINLTLDGITQRVSSVESSVSTIDDEVTSLETRIQTAEQKITPTAIVSTVRQSTEYQNDLDGIDQAINAVDTKIDNKVSEINLSLDGITSRVSDTESAISTIDGEVSSLQSRMQTAEQKITPSAIVQTVRESTAYQGDLAAKGDKSVLDNAVSTISQHATLISQRVEKNNIISEINQTAETIKIEASRIDLVGKVTAEMLNVDDLSAISGKFTSLMAGTTGAERLEMGAAGGSPYFRTFDSENTERILIAPNALYFKNLNALGNAEISSKFHTTAYSDRTILEIGAWGQLGKFGQISVTIDEIGVLDLFKNEIQAHQAVKIKGHPAVYFTESEVW